MAIETNLTMAHASNTESEPEELPDDASDTSSDTSYEVEELQSSEFPGYFEERNGRLFHSHGNSPYPLPVDAPEQNRAKVQHFFLKALLHGNYVGPVQDVLRPTLGERRKVLDLATGTGNWVLDMAQEFPHAKFYGLDIVPIATRMPPNNVRFEMQDIGAQLRFHDGTFDLVHARAVSMTVRNYPALIREVARVLRPQGMFLACEWGRSVASVRDMNSLPKTHRYFRELNRCLDGFGIRPIATHMVAYVTQSGLFYNVSAAVYLIPVGGGHDPCNQYLGWQFFDVMLQYADATKTIMLQAGYTEHRVDELVIGLEEEMRAAQGMFFEYYTVHARKLQV